MSQHFHMATSIYCRLVEVSLIPTPCHGRSFPSYFAKYLSTWVVGHPMSILAFVGLPTEVTPCPICPSYPLFRPMPPIPIFYPSNFLVSLLPPLLLSSFSKSSHPLITRYTSSGMFQHFTDKQLFALRTAGTVHLGKMPQPIHLMAGGYVFKQKTTPFRLSRKQT